MTETTARLALPLIAPGQAQKEMAHNEALTLLDIVVQPVAVMAGADTPPSDPQPGECWIVGASPVGAWAGHAFALAGWTAGGWRFLPPHDGLSLWVQDTGVVARYAGGVWRVGAPAIAAPNGGSVTDQPARDAIARIILALEHHGLALSI